mgnify:CR=1 FL=1
MVNAVTFSLFITLTTVLTSRSIFSPPVGPDAPGFCYGLDEFIAVIDCTMCSCTDRSMSDFCSTKTGPGQVTPPTPPDDKNVVKECTPKETMEGTAAIMDYSECANLDSVSLLITDFD